MKIKKSYVSNCLIFAVLEAIKKGKYIVFRKTRHKHNWFCFNYHVLTIPPEIVEQHAESFVPEKGDLGPLPQPLFRGRVKKGD